jgi:2-(1,2-epoxy-1,2-dihydrophenyl)acetyl-CoA isomerase
VSTVGVAFDGALCVLTLARPTAGNALDLDTAAALLAAVERAAAEGCSVVLLRAEGRVFCGGGDVAAMSGANDPQAYVRRLADTAHDAVRAIRRLGLVLVCAVQGSAAGIGFSLILHADVVIATPEATFTTAYLALGVTPDGGLTSELPRVVGATRAAELCFTGRRLDAATAAEWGIVTRVVATAAELDETSRDVARRVAAAPVDAVRATKRLLDAGRTAELGVHLDAESESISRLIASPESRALQERFLSR